MPLAQALRQAGHEVAVATAPCFAEVVTGAGFQHLAAGIDWDERHLLDTVPELRSVPKIYRGEWMMKNLFLDRCPRAMIAALSTIIPSWHPDMIIAGTFEYGGALAAEKFGLSYANANYTIRWNPWILKHAVGRSIAKLRRENELAPDPELEAFGRYADICFAPPSWSFESALLRPGLAGLVSAKIRGAGLPLRQRLWGLRALLLQRLFARAVRLQSRTGANGCPDPLFVGEDVRLAEQAGSAPALIEGLPRQPNVFVSLGTVLSAEYPDIFDKILTALEGEPVNIIMTLGGGGDPARFGSLPPNARVVRFLSQNELRLLLPHIDLCINHAGYSSVMEALLHGIPLVPLPLVSDAPMNTQMCLSSGVAPDLEPAAWGLSPKGLPVVRADRLSPAIIRDAVMRVLRDPSYRAAALRMQSELAGRLSPDQAARILENVVARQKD